MAENVDKLTENVDKMTENVDKLTENVDKMTENFDKMIKKCRLRLTRPHSPLQGLGAPSRGQLT
jgi:t-SNARE complex subunit (syntaxin)